MKFFLPTIAVLTILPIINCFGNKIAGAPNQIEIDQVERFKPTIEDHLKNNQNGDDWIYVDAIKTATAQVVAGTLYKIEFAAVKTDCSKNNLTNSKEKCKAKENQNSCTVSIWEKPWMKFLEIQTIDCMGVQIKK